VSSTGSFCTSTCPFPVPSFQFAQDISQSNLFLYKYPNNLIPVILPAYIAYENGTDRVFQNVGTQNSDARESPKRMNTTYFSIFCAALLKQNEK